MRTKGLAVKFIITLCWPNYEYTVHPPSTAYCIKLDCDCWHELVLTYVLTHRNASAAGISLRHHMTSKEVRRRTLPKRDLTLEGPTWSPCATLTLGRPDFCSCWRPTPPRRTHEDLPQSCEMTSTGKYVTRLLQPLQVFISLMSIQSHPFNPLAFLFP